MIRLVLWVGLGLGMGALAAVIEGVGLPKTVIEGVPIYSQARISSSAQAPLLNLTGAGIRKKKVLFLKVDVYVAAHYLDASVTLQPESPMESVTKAKAKVMELTFLRDVDSKKIRDAFMGSLTKNEVDLESAAVKEVLAKLTFDMKEKQKLVLVGQGTGSQESLTFEAPTGTMTVKGPSIASNFWRIWFGTPDDGGLEDLKELLVGKISGL